MTRLDHQSNEEGPGKACSPTASPRRVLWIDDLVDLSSPECHELREHGFDVTCVQTGQSGIDLSERAQFDCIILDLNLPDMNGLDILDTLTTRAWNVPIVVLTGIGLLHEAILAMKLGAADFKCKPIDTAELAGLLHTVATRYTRGSEASSEDEWIAIQADRIGCASSRAAAAALVARLIMSERISLRWFPGCVKALRLAISSPEATFGILTADMRVAIRSGRYVRWPTNPKLLHALATLEVARKRQPPAILADAAGLSRCYLSRRLYIETGRHAREWTQDSVVRTAFRRLLQMPEPVSQIAFDLGYEHVSQFNREFGRTFGLAPNALRRLPYLRPRHDTP